MVPAGTQWTYGSVHSLAMYPPLGRGVHVIAKRESSWVWDHLCIGPAWLSERAFLGGRQGSQRGHLLTMEDTEA
jgi:hypothetical protein